MENPHATIVRWHQHRFCVNVWAGIVDDFLLGLYIFPEGLNASSYLIFLQKVLPELLHPIPLNIRRSMRFQHDGASPNFGNVVRGHLTATFGARWIGRGGPTAWPARSPALTCLDFFFRGYMKSMVHETVTESEEDLIARTVSAAAEIRETPSIFGRVRQSMARRCTVCLDVNGCVFQHLLWWDKKLDPSWQCNTGVRVFLFLFYFFGMQYVLFLFVYKIVGLTQRIMWHRRIVICTYLLPSIPSSKTLLHWNETS